MQGSAHVARSLYRYGEDILMRIKKGFGPPIRSGVLGPTTFSNAPFFVAPCLFLQDSWSKWVDIKHLL